MQKAVLFGSVVAFGILAVFVAANLPFSYAQAPPPQQSSPTVSVEIACTMNCPTQQVPQPGPGPRDTRAALVVEGHASPNAFLYILMDGAVSRTAGVSSSGIFSVALTGLSPGQHRVGVYATDTSGLNTPTISIGIVLYEATTTRIYDILLPPTIKADHDVVRQGEGVIVSGQTFPRASVRVMRLPDRQSQEVLADRYGKWETVYSTDKLIDTYTVTGRSLLGSGLLSEPSNEAHFTVVPLPGREPLPPRPPGEAPPARPEGAPPPSCADPNGDRLVNLSDFSILLFNWGVPSDSRIDCNGDGHVDLVDLSVVLYWWTG